MHAPSSHRPDTPATMGARFMRLACSGLVLLQAGCGALDPLNSMRPQPVSPQSAATQLKALDGAASLGEAEYNTAVSDQDRTRDRDQVIAAKILANDLTFENFAWSAWGADVGVATASDWVVLGLTAAGGLATGGASQILSATAAAVTGAKTSLQKNALYSKTIDQLLYAMTVNRTQIRTHIQNCMAYPDSKYSLGAALIDLEQYKQAALLPLAIANLSTTATSGSTQDTCAAAVVVSTIARDSTEKRVSAWVAPGGTLDTAHANALSEWLRTKSGDPAFVAPDQTLKLSWPMILTAPYQADRTRAIQDLNIP